MLLEPQPGLMGSLVEVRITAATRWSVRGTVTAWLYRYGNGCPGGSVCCCVLCGGLMGGNKPDAAALADVTFEGGTWHPMPHGLLASQGSVERSCYCYCYIAGGVMSATVWS